MNLLRKGRPEEYWKPFRELAESRRRMQALSSPPAHQHDKDDLGFATGERPPSVDIAEDDKEYLIKAELPEMREEDIKVTVDDGVLTISGDRKFEQEEKNEKYYRLERAYGRFVWNYILPDATNAAKMSVEFKDSVLKLHLPKDPAAKPTSIEVKVG